LGYPEGESKRGALKASIGFQGYVYLKPWLLWEAKNSNLRPAEVVMWGVEESKTGLGAQIDAEKHDSLEATHWLGDRHPGIVHGKGLIDVSTITVTWEVPNP
jgi:hypothetical protein